MRARHYHPLAAVRIFRKSLWVLLAPLLRAMLLWQPAAFLLALWQDAALLCFITCYTLLAWQYSNWALSLAPSPTLQLRRGVCLRQQLQIDPTRLAAVTLSRPPLLRLVGASHLCLCYRTAALPHTKAPQQLRLTLTKADAASLARLLLTLSPPCQNEHSLPKTGEKP